VQLLTLQRDGWVEPAVYSEGRAMGLREAGFHDMRTLIAGGADALDRVNRWVLGEPASEQIDLGTTPLCAPILNPSKIICIGLNYRDHAEEAKMSLPEVPTVFPKYANTITGHLAPIVLPKNSEKPDYEAELAVVIGRGGRHIPATAWREHVFGYTILNDVSARDFQMRTSQWTMGKVFDTFAPMGPTIVTVDEIEDPHNLRISLTLNGEVMQDSNTSNLVFGIPQLIEFLSSVMTLSPGDIISTGTPAGVGFGKKPPRWLRKGDLCVIEIEGLGKLANPIVAEE
jgi:2-keto-4-pentenoate hydratase/2-oxohepta-3-ene-1,7-dioic acid hydratase in catechol pathway